jgi:hypothetical protein
MMLMPGDILCVRGSGWLSDGIASAEYGGKEPAQSATHVGILIEGDPIPVVIEALNRVMTRPLSVSIAGAQKAFVLYDRSLTNAQREAVVVNACTFSSKDYGYTDLIAQWLDAKLGTFWFTNQSGWLLSHWPICSYVVAASYAAVGLDFGVDTNSVKPSDILTFAQSHPELYQVSQIR